MQITRGALTDVNNKYGYSYSLPDLRDPTVAIFVAGAFLRMARDSGLSLFDAVRAYNAGVRGVKRSSTISRNYAESVYHEF